MGFSSIFAKLKADEIAAIAVPLKNVCAALATGDGSTASIVGQGVVLQGAVITLQPQLQKIGVNDFFAALGEEIDKAAKSAIASAAADTTANGGTEKAGADAAKAG